METLYRLLSGLVNDASQVRLLFLAVITLASFLLITSLIFLITGIADPVRRRLRQLNEHQEEKAQHWSQGKFMQTFALLGKLILPKKEAERNKISTKLIHAGFRSPSAVTLFYAFKVGGLVLLVLVAFYAAILFHLSSSQMLLSVSIAFIIGLILPDIILDRFVRKRERVLRRGFPDALDLLVVCTEAGMGLNGALQRVAEELSASHPELASELALVNIEIRAGIDRTVALNNLTVRNNLQDIKGLVAALSQSLRFGTSIADTLRIYSEELRDKRMQKAEEEAAKISVKMIFPLVLCLFPTLFVVLIGPAVLNTLKVLGK